MKEAGNLNVLDFLFGRLMAQLKALRKLARVKKSLMAIVAIAESLIFESNI
jgi:hypothetical protein